MSAADDAWRDECSQLDSDTEARTLRWADAVWQFGPARVIGEAHASVGDAFADRLHDHLIDRGWSLTNGEWSFSEEPGEAEPLDEPIEMPTGRVSPAWARRDDERNAA